MSLFGHDYQEYHDLFESGSSPVRVSGLKQYQGLTTVFLIIVGKCRTGQEAEPHGSLHDPGGSLERRRYCEPKDEGKVIVGRPSLVLSQLQDRVQNIILTQHSFLFRWRCLWTKRPSLRPATLPMQPLRRLPLAWAASTFPIRWVCTYRTRIDGTVKLSVKGNFD